MKEHPEFIRNIDWNLLREQKQVILELENMTCFNVKDQQAFNGIIHLIDALQDFATNEMGLSEKEVFNLTPDENE